MSDKTMMPVSEQHEAALEEHLRTTGRGLFESPAVFIKLYNSGIINKSNDEVKDTARRIVDTYKNIREQGNDLIFLSEAEVVLDEVKASLEPWYIVTSLKRIVGDLVENGELSAEDEIAFSTRRDIGYLLSVTSTHNEDGQPVTELSKISREKLFTRAEQVHPIFNGAQKILTNAYEQDDHIVFTVSEVYNVDDSFVLRIHGLLSQ